MERIEQFMEDYWKWPTLDLEKNIDTQIEEEEKFMLKKYGEETIKKRDFLIAEYCNCPRNLEQKFRDNIISFDYATGISEDAYCRPNLRSKKTLETLLSFFSSTEGDLILIDAGCGDGKITLGLAACLQNIKKIYAIDKKPAAINRFKKIIGESQLIEKITKKIILIQGDYTQKDTYQRLIETAGADYILALYSFPTRRLGFSSSNTKFPIPQRECLASLKEGISFTSKRGKLLLAHELNPSELMNQAGYTEEEILNLADQKSILDGMRDTYIELLNISNDEVGFSFRNISFKRVFSQLIVTLDEGQLKENKLLEVP